jgi:membrane protease YdiL (CAAX protease family)
MSDIPKKHDSNTCLMTELIFFDPSKPMADIKTQIIVGFAIVILTSLIYNFIYKLFPENVTKSIESDKNSELVALQKKNVSIYKLAFAEILNGAIFAPISEELFFRFFLMKILFTRQFKMNPHVANLIQASIFGVLHLSNTVYSDQGPKFSAAQSLSSFIIGAVSGLSYIQTNSILPSLIAHIVNNLWAASFQIQSYKNFIDTK